MEPNCVLVELVMRNIHVVNNDSSALIYSMVQTAIANNFKLEHYLRCVYEQIQLQKELVLENILPWSEKIPGECKNKTSD